MGGVTGIDYAVLSRWVSSAVPTAYAKTVRPGKAIVLSKAPFGD